MSFISFDFLLLFPFVVIAYYVIPRKFRQWYLLIINICFYLSFGWKYVFVLLAIALVAWGTGITVKMRSWIIAISTALLVVILSFFKLNIYENIYAPIGLSFYTFQAISYIVDVYRNDIEADNNFFNVLLYLSFFSTITSGPILRKSKFEEQLKLNIETNVLTYERVTDGIVYMIWGFFLKLMIADRVAIYVNQVFGNFVDENYGTLVLLIAVFGYSIQIYADFAGYSAIAIGVAQIIGFDIPENFCAPYLSHSIKEFWSRWHISLSMWLRDYIYIPLGGNRKGRLRQCVNIMITFVISGAWHGAMWHFVVWGGLHGIYQVIGNLTKPIRKKLALIVGINEESELHHCVQVGFTFVLVTIAWVFFRNGIHESILIGKRILVNRDFYVIKDGTLRTIGFSSWIEWVILAISTMVMFGVDLLTIKKQQRIDAFINNQGVLGKGFIIAVMVLSILIFGIYGNQHDASYFVYTGF